LTRAILTETDRITLLSRYESRAEQEMGFLTVLPFAVPHPARQLQVTTRADWLPAGRPARIGVTAGASTPNNKIGETVARILATRGLVLQTA